MEEYQVSENPDGEFPLGVTSLYVQTRVVAVHRTAQNPPPLDALALSM